MADEHRLYGLVGYPITFVRSPGILNAYLAEKGLPGRMIPFGVKPEALATAVTGLRCLENLAGFFITMPFKEVILSLLDELSETARIAGAVNIVRRTPDGRLQGHQLDGAGFVSAMKAADIPIAGANAYVAGAGGVSAGICCALAEVGIGRIAINNRNTERAERLAERLRTAFPKTDFIVSDTQPGEDVDIVINATNLGIDPADPLPVDLSKTRAGIYVGDVVNRPHTTALILTAQARGYRIQPGSAMFEPQIELALRFFEHGL